MTAVLILAAWVVASVPTSLVVARFISPNHPPQENTER